MNYYYLLVILIWNVKIRYKKRLGTNTIENLETSFIFSRQNNNKKRPNQKQNIQISNCHNYCQFRNEILLI